MNLGYGPLWPDEADEPENMKWVSQYSNANMVKTDFLKRSRPLMRNRAL